MTRDPRQTILERRVAFMRAALAAAGLQAAAGCAGERPATAADPAPNPLAAPTPARDPATSVPAYSPPAPTVPEPAPPPMVRLAVCLSVNVLRSPTFVEGSTELVPGSEEFLDDAAKALIDNPEVRVVVEGHTDAVEAKRSTTLDDARAGRVRELLVARGVESSRLCPRGLDAEWPLAPNDTAANRAKNRRVALRVLEPDEVCEGMGMPEPPKRP